VAEDAGFDAVVTTDKGIRHQRNLAGRRLALVVIGANDWTRIRKSRSAVVGAISEISPGCFLEVELPSH
jgi:hypothetical protein